MPFQPFAHDWDRAQWSSHEQWQWLAVEIAKIRRCAGVGDQAHDRLALLLTDHLVEVIVGREVNTRLAWQLADSVVEEMREIRDRRGVKPRPRYWPK
jgi:soluble P-type ATPase